MPHPLMFESVRTACRGTNVTPAPQTIPSKDRRPGFLLLLEKAVRGGS